YDRAQCKQGCSSKQRNFERRTAGQGWHRNRPRGPAGDRTGRHHRGSTRTTLEEGTDSTDSRETAGKRYHPGRHQGLSRVFLIISVSVSTRWFIAGSLYS